MCRWRKDQHEARLDTGRAGGHDEGEPVGQGTGFAAVFNIEADPREEVNVLGTNAWVISPYLRVIGEYRKTLEKHPNPRAVNMTDFGR